MNYFNQVTEAAKFLRGRLGKFRPRVAAVLGSGLGAVAGAVKEPIVVPYSEIPHFPQSTVEGHEGRMVAGSLGGAPVLLLQGRVHYYEGYTPQQVTFPIRVLGALGLKVVILTNAAGGICEKYHQGQLVVLADHINMTGWNPLVGPNEPKFSLRKGTGLRFTDMSEAYSKRLREMALRAAVDEGITMEEGVYVGVSGPSFETPAEIRAFRTMGATLVGMSTVPETIVARHMGMEVLGISCVTNLAAGLSKQHLSHQEVFETGRLVERRLSSILERLAVWISTMLEAEL
ncbi:MAG TPA: purine-nucleoside phosphorylase [Terracidiphilus sp.]|nr:purine-nucleoside phosphorylase [Terracidiphilus sp.]